MSVNLLYLPIGKQILGYLSKLRVSSIFKQVARKVCNVSNQLITLGNHAALLQSYSISRVGFMLLLAPSTIAAMQNDATSSAIPTKARVDPWLFIYLLPSIVGIMAMLWIIVFLVKEFLGHAKQKERGMVLSELSTEQKLWEEKNLEDLLYARQGNVGLIPFLFFLLGSKADSRAQRSKARTDFLNQLYCEMEARIRLRSLAIESKTYEQESYNKFIDVNIEKVRLQMEYQITSYASHKLPHVDEKLLNGDGRMPAILARPPRIRYTLITSLIGHSSYVSSIAFSKDGKFLASGSWDRNIKIWKVSTGECTATFKCDSKVYSVAYSSHNLLASGNGNGEILVWDMGKDAKPVKLDEGHSQVIESIAFLPSDEQLVTASWAGTLNLWNIKTGQKTSIIYSPSYQYSSVAFSPNGSTLIAASWERTARVFNTRTWKEIISTEDEIHAKHIAFSPKGDKMAASNWDKKIILWNCSEWKEIAALEDHPDDVSAVAISPDSKVIAAACMDGSVKLWNAYSYATIDVLKSHGESLSSLAFSPDGQLLALASLDGTISLWSSSYANS